MKDRITILYIDDEYLNLLVFEENFNSKYDICTAESGKEALEILKLKPEIQIVISDMKMPVMNGLEFIKQAKKNFPHKAYFILSGYNINEEIYNAINEKIIIKYFGKPFKVEEIISSIEESIVNK